MTNRQSWLRSFILPLLVLCLLTTANAKTKFLGEVNLGSETISLYWNYDSETYLLSVIDRYGINKNSYIVSPEELSRIAREYEKVVSEAEELERDVIGDRSVMQLSNGGTLGFTAAYLKGERAIVIEALPAQGFDRNFCAIRLASAEEYRVRSLLNCISGESLESDDWQTESLFPETGDPPSRADSIETPDMLEAKAETGFLSEKQLNEIRNQCGDLLGGQILVPTWIPEGWGVSDIKATSTGYTLIFSGGVTQVELIASEDKAISERIHHSWDGQISCESAIFGSVTIRHFSKDTIGFYFCSDWFSQAPKKLDYRLQGAFRIHRDDKESAAMRLVESLKFISL